MFLTQISGCYSPRPIVDAGFEFDVCYTSVLQRAIRTLWLVLDGIDQMWLPVFRTWRLNERHYGGLTGLNKAETAARHGEAQVKVWRRSYDIPPPPMDAEHELFSANVQSARYCLPRRHVIATRGQGTSLASWNMWPSLVCMEGIFWKK